MAATADLGIFFQAYMIRFKVKTWSDHVVNIEVYPTRKEFIKQYREKFGLKGNGRACCFHYLDGNKRKEISTIAFCAKDLNVGTVTHEFVHAFTSVYAQNKWDYLKSKDNEELAWNLGYAVGDCCMKLEQYGFKIKYSPD